MEGAACTPGLSAAAPGPRFSERSARLGEEGTRPPWTPCSAQGRRAPRARAEGPAESRGGEAGRRAQARPRVGPGSPPSPPPPSRPPRPATMRRLPRALLLPVPLALLVAAAAPEAPVSAPRSLVWGPGLQAGVVLPVRYFYLQAVNSEGQNLTGSPQGSVQTRASLALQPAPPRVPAAPGPLGTPPAACVGVRRPALGLVTFSVRLPCTGGRSRNKSLLNE